MKLYKSCNLYHICYTGYYFAVYSLKMYHVIHCSVLAEWLNFYMTWTECALKVISAELSLMWLLGNFKKFMLCDGIKIFWLWLKYSNRLISKIFGLNLICLFCSCVIICMCILYIFAFINCLMLRKGCLLVKSSFS